MNDQPDDIVVRLQLALDAQNELGGWGCAFDLDDIKEAIDEIARLRDALRKQ